MNAESFIKQKEITWDKPFSHWNRTAFKKALNEFAEIQKEAINYTRCCTELKDKKEMTFKEYLISKGYKLSNNYVWQIDSRDLSNDDIIEQRKQYEYSL